MPKTIEASYTKTLKLPGGGSRRYSTTLRTQLSDPSQVEAEIGRLFELLQGSVDSGTPSRGPPEHHARNGAPQPVSEVTSDELEAAFNEERAYRYADDEPA